MLRSVRLKVSPPFFWRDSPSEQAEPAYSPYRPCRRSRLQGRKFARRPSLAVSLLFSELTGPRTARLSLDSAEKVEQFREAVFDARRVLCTAGEL